MAENRNRLFVKVASPAGTAFSAAALSLTLQTADGVIQVLPGHTDLITALEAGEMVVVDEREEEKVFALGEGFALIGADVITILANFAEDDASMNEEAVEFAKSSAEAALRGAAAMTGQEREAQEFLLNKSVVQLRVLNRRKHGRNR